LRVGAARERLGSEVAVVKESYSFAFGTKTEDQHAEGCQEHKAANFSSVGERNTTACLSIANEA
jgi:hypothetical protein